MQLLPSLRTVPVKEEQGSPDASLGSVQHSPRQASLHDCDELELTLPSSQILDFVMGELVGLGEGLAVGEWVGLKAFFFPSFCRLRTLIDEWTPLSMTSLRTPCILSLSPEAAAAASTVTTERAERTARPDREANLKIMVGCCSLERG